MEFFKRYWAQTRVYLEGLTFAEKALVGALVVVLLMAGGWLLSWAGSPQMVPISAFAGVQNEEVISRLQGYRIEARREGGQVLVPSDKYEEALMLLAQHDLMSADTSQAFNELIERQSPWQTDRQNQQAYLLAKQRVLAQIVSKMRGVQRADVILSEPQNQGFGRTHERPSASVSVWMRGSNRVDDAMVDSIARLVAGSVAEMRPQNVSITDANHGRTRTVRDADDMLPTDTLELVHKLEEYHRQKIDGVLGYIRGVIVAVNVQVDPIARMVQEEFNYEDNEPLESEEIEEMISRDMARGGEPGARSNTGLNIAGSDGTERTEEHTRTRTTFREKPMVLRSQSTRAGHQVQRINVSINVPRRYFVNIYKANNPDADPPDDATLQEMMEDHLQRIQSQVEPLMMAELEGVVRAHMIPDDSLMPTTAGMQATGGLEGLLVGGWARPVGVTLLALMALGLMLMMVRKATQDDALPSVEELAGVPPELPVDEEFIGEVDSGDAGLAGVEVNEDDMNSRRIAEQISEMIKGNPNEAGTLIGRWVRRGD
ncbi:hypothetical protein ACERK3_10090 [Phycisphaerales bacterium AB-hyl4]|uniref:Flagellar M-ring N-terminal domain-containing protein n=1 Tax=Natronomicrosphaera hydrolytica TaxID=3242702 RepID=A0ABV4U648_9BACT